MKIRLEGVELFHPGGRTDMTKLRVYFRNFANAPKNRQVFLAPSAYKIQLIPDRSRSVSVRSASRLILYRETDAKYGT